MKGSYDFVRSIREFDHIRYTFPSLRTLNQEHSQFVIDIPRTDIILSLEDDVFGKRFDVIHAEDTLHPNETNITLVKWEPVALFSEYISINSIENVWKTWIMSIKLVQNKFIWQQLKEGMIFFHSIDIVVVKKKSYWMRQLDAIFLWRFFETCLRIGRISREFVWVVYWLWNEI